MKINLKAFVILAVLVSVVVVSGCAQPGGQNATTAPGATQIKSAEDASKAIVDTSKDVKKISDTLADIDSTLAGKK